MFLFDLMKVLLKKVKNEVTRGSHEVTSFVFFFFYLTYFNKINYTP